MKGFNGKKKHISKRHYIERCEEKEGFFFKKKTHKNVFLFKISKHKNMSTI